VPGKNASGSTDPFAAPDEPGRIFVVTFGSGSCPNLPTSVTASGSHLIVITTHEHMSKGDDACTDDLGPTTSTVDVPKAISAPFSVEIDGYKTVLPAG
jgi:hypothetical protein